LLANVAVFELFKEITGVQAKVFENTNERPFYLLNLETLEGNWHSVIPHPLVTGRIHKEPIEDPLLFIEKRNKEQNDLHALFYQITSKESGIFHSWEEEDLLQLPLSQCKVQVADPCSDSPARLQAEIVCSGLTHEEARLEAGLSGLESYVSHFNDDLLGIGTGATSLEGLCRALQNGLHEEFVKQTANGAVLQSKLDSKPLKDSRCQFLMKALSTLQSKPELYLGQELFGFPVVWVGSNGQWYGSVGLDMKIALNRALQTAVMDAQNKEMSRNPYGVVTSSPVLKNHDPAPHKVPVPPLKRSRLKKHSLQPYTH
jgi:putative thiazole-containing bacteriocin maturation protein